MDEALIESLVAQSASLSAVGLSRLIAVLAERLTMMLGPATHPTLPPQASAPAREGAASGSEGLVGAEHTTPAAPPDAPGTEYQPEPEPLPLPVGETYEAVGQGGELIIPNGIDPTTCRPRYRLDLAGARQVAAVNRWADKAPQRSLHAAAERRTVPHLGVVYGFSYDKLAVSEKGAGWGLVVAAEEDAFILKALSPLIEKRCRDQGLAAPPLTFHEGETCGVWLRRVLGDDFVNKPMKASPPVPIFLYDAQKDTTVYQWCSRHGVAVEAVDPGRGVPYYLLLVGRPGARFTGDPHIPFSFQYDLDFFWGVGRIGFTDDAGNHRYDAYTAYAEQLVAIERDQVARRDRSIAYVATRHELDQSTILSSDELVAPLFQGTGGREPLAHRFSFTAHGLIAEQATRSALERLLVVEMGRPGLLFSATHGIDLPRGHPDQILEQGALLCQDWSGIGPARREHWFAGNDLPERTDVAGMVGLCFACFSAGCPSHDQFHFSKDQPPAEIAPYASLPSCHSACWSGGQLPCWAM